MFRSSAALLKNLVNENQASRKASQAINAVRRHVEDVRRAKEDRAEMNADLIVDRLVLEAHRELHEEQRAQQLGMSVDTLRYNERKAGRLQKMADYQDRKR